MADKRRASPSPTLACMQACTHTLLRSPSLSVPLPDLTKEHTWVFQLDSHQCVRATRSASWAPCRTDALKCVRATRSASPRHIRCLVFGTVLVMRSSVSTWHGYVCECKNELLPYDWPLQTNILTFYFLKLTTTFSDCDTVKISNTLQDATT